MIMSLLQALQAIARSPQRCCPQIRPGDCLCRLRIGEGRTEPWSRPFMKVLEEHMEPFTRTLPVRIMNQEDSQSVN